MKRFICILSAIIIALTLCGCSVDDGYPKPTDKFFINDFADIISDSAENEIYIKNAALFDKTTAQIAVITVDSIGGEAIADYALNIGREWGVGDEEKDNGIVLLLAEEEREVYIAVGYGLEGALPDSKTGRILDRYGIPYFSEDNFSQGLVEVNKALVNEVYIEYGLSADEGYIPINQLPDANEETGSTKILGSWIILIIFVIVYLFLFRGRGIIFFGGPRGFGGGGFGGGFGGSSGGFRGGGGSFGGGGAGRGF